MVKVLFVCLGNICRSPMAEAVFREMVKKEGIEDRFHIDSAGIGGWHEGKRPHSGTLQILEEKQISSEGIFARQIRKEDLKNFDYIVAMDSENLADIEEIEKDQGATAKIFRLLDLVPERKDKDIPDPYYTGNFDYVYTLVQEGCRALLEQIKKDEEWN